MGWENTRGGVKKFFYSLPPKWDFHTTKMSGREIIQGQQLRISTDEQYQEVGRRIRHEASSPEDLLKDTHL